MLLYRRNEHNIVNQLYFNKTGKKKDTGQMTERLNSASSPVSLALLEGWQPVWQHEAEANVTGVQVLPVRCQVPDLMVRRAGKRKRGQRCLKGQLNKESGLPS